MTSSESDLDMKEGPNVLFLVWDACRLDTARSHAPNLASLAENNIWFENAIAPAGNSLPSHVSMFTGEYPHEHGIHRTGQEIGKTPLLAELGEMGYSRYGISANGFASPMYGFDRGFDEFYNTTGQMVYPDGLDVHRFARQFMNGMAGVGIGDIEVSRLFRAALEHDHPLKSLVNIVSAGVQKGSDRIPYLRHVPHPWFSDYPTFNYDPDTNTESIRSVLEQESGNARPFFVFSNYMDTHNPYAPPERYQREYCGKQFSYRELLDVADAANPLRFLEDDRRIDADLLADIRDLYSAAVRTVDDHLGKLVDSLERQGLREETLIVITADHGENLGERNATGEREMGHVSSVTDNLFRVPLLVAHPELPTRTVETHVSIKDLYEVVANAAEVVEGEAYIEPFFDQERYCFAEFPSVVDTAFEERHPTIANELDRHWVAAYSDGWKVAVASSGEKRAWENGTPCEVDAVPSEAVRKCREYVACFEEQGTDTGLSEVDIEHLESLGYL